jgi:pSer/pThr/pTyr-binding forkhead associated (FHA) protein
VGEPASTSTPSASSAEAVDLLVVNSGPSLGARFELGQGPISVGRSVASDIFLDDVTVSRSHARFVRTDSGRLAVQDVGSLNGTYVNHVRVEEKILDSGDEIQIGKFKLIYLPAKSR